MVLRVYATVFNNASRVKASLDSIAPLKPYKIYVTDNYSTDGTYEILKNYKNLVVTRRRCKRGEGRRIALQNLIEDSSPKDAVLVIDLDVIYKDPYIKFIKQKLKGLKDDEIYADTGQLSTVRTNMKVQWRNLIAHEDNERLARAASLGIKLYRMRNLEDNFWENEKVAQGKPRESRYTKNMVSMYARYLDHLVDDQRGGAYKSFGAFYAISSVKSTTYFCGYLAAYVIAEILGVYSYDKKLNNKEYIAKHSIFIDK